SHAGASRKRRSSRSVLYIEAAPGPNSRGRAALSLKSLSILPPRHCVDPSNDAPYDSLASAKSLKRSVDIALFQVFAVFWKRFQNRDRLRCVYGEARGGRFRADRDVRVVEQTEEPFQRAARLQFAQDVALLRDDSIANGHIAQLADAIEESRGVEAGRRVDEAIEQRINGHFSQ
ncbi:MAG: hypothetical protein ABSE69_14450, partial [Roseiarcus sp.]